MVSLYRKTAYKAWILRSKEQQGTSWSSWDAYRTLNVLPGMTNENGWNENEWLLDSLSSDYAWGLVKECKK